MAGSQQPDVVPGNLVRRLPTILVGKSGSPLPEAAMRMVERVVVDSHLHLPDMFEITFAEETEEVAALSALAIGTEVTVSAAGVEGKAIEPLIVGEVTSVEGVFGDLYRTVVRGYSADHRLQRVRRTRTFVNMKLSDIARKVARDAGLTIGRIAETRTAHDHITQVNQSDWDFLSHHAMAIGARVAVTGGEFELIAAGPATATPVKLPFPVHLRSFTPRVTAGNLAAEAEVRVWDPVAAKVTTAKADTTSPAVRLAAGEPADLAAAFATTPAAPAKPPGRSPAGDLGPPPSESAYVVSDWPLASGAAATAAATEAAQGVAAHLGDTFAEAEGEAIGDPQLLAGVVADISGVSALFCGQWTITRARHLFSNEGYRTRFEVSGGQDRSLLGLAGRGTPHRGAPVIPGVVCGIVTNNNDPTKNGRVKVALPWLSPAHESDWSPVVQAGAGPAAGTVLLPEVGDEVLVGFEFGNPQRAYVLGGVPTDKSRYTLGGQPIMVKGETGAVVWRGLVTPSGNRLAFHDEMPPGTGKQPPIASDLVLGTANAAMALAIDQVAGTVTLSCKPAPPDSKSAKGALTIECGDAGTIDIKVGAGGAVNIDGGAQLTMKAKAAVKIESQGVVEIKGAQVKLN